MRQSRFQRWYEASRHALRERGLYRVPYVLFRSLWQERPDVSVDDGVAELERRFPQSVADAVLRRAMAMVDVGDGGCWLWRGTRGSSGYGQICIRGPHRTRAIRGAHRVLYEMLRGPVPEGLELDHLCRVRHCVNPDHLEPVTRTENVRRGAARKPLCVKCGRATQAGVPCRPCRRLYEKTYRRAWRAARKERLNPPQSTDVSCGCPAGEEA